MPFARGVDSGEPEDLPHLLMNPGLARLHVRCWLQLHREKIEGLILGEVGCISSFEKAVLHPHKGVLP